MQEEFSVITEHLTKIYKIYSKSWLRVLSALNSNIKYKKFYALQDISIKIPKGEVVGIVGKNGHGKSTFLKLVTGVTKPSDGTIETHGRIVAMLELTSGFDKELTGLENVYIKARSVGMSKADIEARLDDICDFADIGDYINQPVRTYSSGMKSRLGFAVSVNLDPDILIVDEVLAVGDTAFKMKCLARMEEFRKQGKTILFVSHDLSTVKAFCTSCMWIKQGHLVEYGSTGSVVQDYQDYLKAERETENRQRREADKDILLSKDDIVKQSKVKLRNEKEDKGKEKFKREENIVISAEYDVKTEIEKLICAISIFDSENHEVFGSDRQNQAFEIKHEQGHHKLLLKITKPNLLPGHYVMCCEIWNPNSGFVKCIMDKKKFEIVSDKFLGTGVVNMNCECHSE